MKSIQPTSYCPNCRVLASKIHSYYYRKIKDPENRMRWKLHIRFGGEHMKTYHSSITRRWVFSLHYPEIYM
jgi:hypothetical protein